MLNHLMLLFASYQSLTGVDIGRVNAIGSLPELESSKRFAQHLVMNVPDLEEAVKFYTIGLGMTVRFSSIALL